MRYQERSPPTSSDDHNKGAVAIDGGYCGLLLDQLGHAIKGSPCGPRVLRPRPNTRGSLSVTLRFRGGASGPDQHVISVGSEGVVDAAAGIAKAPLGSYTLRQAAGDWLATGLPGRSAKTIRKNNDVLEPILAVAGRLRLKDLSADDDHRA